MPYSVTVNGTSYSLPSVGETDWSSSFNSWTQGVSATIPVIGVTGAVGNGANDSAVFQAAVNRASTAGGVVQMPAGVYKADIVLPADANKIVGLRGQGSGSKTLGTVLQPWTTGGNAIAATQTVFCNPVYILEDFSVVGPDSGSTATSGHGIAITGSAAAPIVLMKNVYITQFKGTGKVGLYLDGPEDCRIDSVHCSANYNGMYCSGAFNGNTISNLTIDLSTNDALTLDDAGSNEWTGVIQSNVKNGLVVLEGINNTFHVHFENNNTSATGSKYAVRIAGATNKTVAYTHFVNCQFNTSSDTVYVNGAASYTAHATRFTGGYATPAAFTFDTYTTGTVLDGISVASLTVNGDYPRVFDNYTNECTMPRAILRGYGAANGPLRITPQATAPTTPLEGELYMNSVDHKLYVYNASAWVVVGTQS